MIVIIEPQCKNFSHEKVNSGFLYGVRLAYPNEALKVFAHPTHIEALTKILIHDGIEIHNIEFVAIDFRDTFSLSAISQYYSIFKDIFFKTINAGENKVFFLSFNPLILFVIKILKNKSELRNMKFTFVLHGSFEKIAKKESQRLAMVLPRDSFETLDLNYLSSLDFKKRLIKIAGHYRRKIKSILSRLSSFSFLHFFLEMIFTEKRMLNWRSSSDFKYFALSPHVIDNAKKYLNLDSINIIPIVLPTVFAKLKPIANNEFIKFAVFGYGKSIALHNVLVELSKYKISKKYEIRIIGMDHRGTEGFLNVTSPSQGRPLAREEMEALATDIDVFLILYDQSQYRLSCSGSILESISYAKPILHFDNDCINYFNRLENPIGVKCKDIEHYAMSMRSMIENYDKQKPELENYRNNILILREKVEIKNSLAQIRIGLSWK